MNDTLEDLREKFGAGQLVKRFTSSNSFSDKTIVDVLDRSDGDSEKYAVVRYFEGASGWRASVDYEGGLEVVLETVAHHARVRGLE